MNKYAEVAPAIPLSPNQRQTYTYQIRPNSQPNLKRYSRVTVPFGPRQVSGVVLRLHQQPVRHPTKPITTTSAITLTTKQIALAKWIARTMHGGLGYTLRLFQPPGPQLPAPHPAPDIKLRPASNQLTKSLAASDTVIIDANPPRRRADVTRAVVHCIATGQQVLILIPEIQLENPWQTALKSVPSALRFVLDSHQPVSHRQSVWADVNAGHPLVVVGTQKSVYLPWQKLGLIVVDEEFYSTHKLWDQYPRLDNRDAAPQLAAIHDCPILYSSSYPSLKLWHQIEQKKVKYIQPETTSSPAVSIHPYSFADKVNKYQLPNRFLTKLKNWSKSNQRILLFYNRRDAARLRTMLAQHFPSLASAGINLATSAAFTQGPGVYDRIAWLWPEQSLSYPDYRSNEQVLYSLWRLSQLLVSRRRSISVITRRSNLVESILKSPFGDTYRQWLTPRRRFNYPPYFDVVRLSVKDKTNNAAYKKAVKLRQQLDQAITTQLSKQPIKIRGPFRALTKSSSKPLAHILLTGQLSDLTDLYANLSFDQADLSPHTII